MPAGPGFVSVTLEQTRLEAAVDLVVATDFSAHGMKVLGVARHMGEALGARLWVIHVVAPQSDFRAYGGGARTDRNVAAQELRQEHRLVQAAAAALREDGLEAVGLMIEGPPVQTILDEAGRLEADLIIIGSHGYGAVFSALLGSVSSGVVRKASCPVLVVPVQKAAP